MSVLWYTGYDITILYFNLEVTAEDRNEFKVTVNHPGQIISAMSPFSQR